MMRFLLRLAALCALSGTAHASIIPPVSEGVWHAEKVLPAAIESGDFSQIDELLTPEAVVLSDDGKILAQGPKEIIEYLHRWYAKGNHVSEIYPGYASVIVFVTRETDHPWDKDYAMVVTCSATKIARIMTVNRNPNLR
jgi:hypothetical protein